MTTIKIADYLNTDLILFLDPATRDEALNIIIDTVHNAGKLDRPENFYQAILDREKLVSTGIGMGVAIPHAKLAAYDHFFIAIAILKHGVDWHAIDGSPVRLVFMIGGPDDKQTEYLQLLSLLTQILKNEERRKKIFTLNSPDAIMQLFQNL